MIEKIGEAIYKAKAGISKLTSVVEIIGFPGFARPTHRHLLNNLGAISNKYLEIGIFRGSSLLSTCYRNKHLSAVAMDNWSQFTKSWARIRGKAEPKTEPWEDLNIRLKKHSQDLPPIKVLDVDCFTNEAQRQLGNFTADLYFYDGCHEEHSQRKGIEEYLHRLTSPAIVLVDDWERDKVRKGTFLGFNNLKKSFLAHWCVEDNGIEMGVFLV